MMFGCLFFFHVGDLSENKFHILGIGGIDFLEGDIRVGGKMNSES